MNKYVSIFTAASLMTSCTVSSHSFQENPKAVSKADICRLLLGAYDQRFSQKLITELKRRGEDPGECAGSVQRQNDTAKIIAAIAIIGGVAAVCAKNNCGGGGNIGNSGYAWDHFFPPNAYGNTWACRSRASGEFVESHYCSGLVMVDNTWPG